MKVQVTNPHGDFIPFWIDINDVSDRGKALFLWDSLNQYYGCGKKVPRIGEGWRYFNGDSYTVLGFA